LSLYKRKRAKNCSNTFKKKTEFKGNRLKT
jgi:hypothetical protein